MADGFVQEPAEIFLVDCSATALQLQAPDTMWDAWQPAYVYGEHVYGARHVASGTRGSLHLFAGQKYWQPLQLMIDL